MAASGGTNWSERSQGPIGTVLRAAMNTDAIAFLIGSALSRSTFAPVPIFSREGSRVHALMVAMFAVVVA